jgi:hypothetical protein
MHFVTISGTGSVVHCDTPICGVYVLFTIYLLYLDTNLRKFYIAYTNLTCGISAPFAKLEPGDWPLSSWRLARTGFRLRNAAPRETGRPTTASSYRQQTRPIAIRLPGATKREATP